MKRPLLGLSIVFVLAAVTVRILRHFGLIDLPPNVAPVAAVALFGGAHLPKRVAIVLPLAAMFLSDAVIGFYQPAIMASVYASFLVTSILGVWLRGRTATAVVGATLMSSTLFFLVTNAAVWAFGTLYPHHLGGLLASYVAGLPFFRNTLLGDLGFVGLLFGTYAVAVAMVGRRLATERST